MAIDWSTVKETLSDALELDGDRRAAFLHARCGSDARLRDAVERLIHEHDSATGFFDEPLRAAPRAMASPVPTRIGPYQLHEAIGEGGFGVVYRATQTTPFAREVAIKLLKPYANAAGVAERFRTERDALARMDHPDICRVFDAGLSDDGAPFVVMELVRGTSVDTYCARRGLDLRRRAAIVARVARAIHHAHQRAILHCDIKPSNILVSEEDGALRLRLIDFGIARALDMAGHYARSDLAGTPRYMSPERRAAGSVSDIRSDVFSLGAVLNEMLPSPAHARTLDLRAIAARAMAVSPDDRYDSAAAFADDIDRALRSEPVLAVGGGRLYRFRRFLGRHRLTSALSALALVAMIAGSAVALRERHEALVARDAATREARRAEFVSAFLLDDMLGSVDPDVVVGRDVTVLELLGEVERNMQSRLGDDPLLLSDVAGALGIAYRRLGKSREAVPALELAIKARESIAPPDPATILGWRVELATALLELPERHGDGMALRTRNLVEATAALGALHPVTMRARLVSFEAPADWNDRVTELNAMVAEAKAIGADGDEVVEDGLRQLAIIHGGTGAPKERIAALEEMLAFVTAQFGPRHSKAINARNLLGEALVDNGDFERGIAEIDAALADARVIYKPEHATFTGRLFGVVRAKTDAGMPDEALALSRELEAILRGRDGVDSATHASARRLLGQSLVANGHFEEARSVLEPVIPVLRSHWGDRHAQVAPALHALARAKHGLGDMTGALAAADDAASCAKPKSATALANTRLRIELLAELGRTENAQAAFDAALQELTTVDDAAHGNALHEIGRRRALNGARAE